MSWFTETLHSTVAGYAFVLNLCPRTASRLQHANAVDESTKWEIAASENSPHEGAQISFFES
jgi:hypothetical protein